jgi:hypothetical protein
MAMTFEKSKVLQLPRKRVTDPPRDLSLRCGETVPESGIYEVVHNRRQADFKRVQAVAIRGELVKPCSCCGEEVQFRLLYAAPHISEDVDFCDDSDS